MNSILDNFTEFWEILTGVFDDNKARIIRLICFSALTFGIMWAAANYFKADKIADTDVEFYRTPSTEGHADRAALKRMADMAQAVQDMRNGGEAIAETIIAANTRPFNIDGYNEAGLENLGDADISRADVISMMSNKGASEDVVRNVEIQAPAITVKAVMLAGKNAGAVIDTPDEKNKMVKRGEKLEGLGRIVRINRGGVTLRNGRQEFIYPIAALKSTLDKKSGSASDSNSKKSNLGVEEFLFKGTVPDDSPLAPTAKE